MIRFLVTSLTKALLHQLLSLASSRKSYGCFKRLPLRLSAAEIIQYPSPALCIDSVPLPSSVHRFSTPPQLCASIQSPSPALCIDSVPLPSSVHRFSPPPQLCASIQSPSPALCIDSILSRRSTGNSLDCMAWFVLCRALLPVGPYIDRCLPFQIMSNQLNSSQVDSNQVDQWNQDAPELDFECHAKGVNTYVHVILYNLK